MRALRPALFVSVVALLVTGGCVRIPREVLRVQHYSLDGPRAVTPVERPLPLSLLIPPFLADARQRGERIMFRTAEHAMDQYFYHRWVVSPAQMVGDALANHLLQWGVVGDGIVRSGVGMVPTHELHGRLVSLYAHNIKKEYGAYFEVALTLLRVDPKEQGRKVVFQKSYRIVVDRTNSSIASFIVAANRALAQWLEEVRGDLRPVLEEEGRVFAAAPARGD